MTLFANEADFMNSDNQGFVVIDKESGRCKVRLDGQVWTTTLESGDDTISEELCGFMTAVMKDYDYLFVK